MTGTSVIAVKYKDGVMMAADCLGTIRGLFPTMSYVYYIASYGSLARFRDVQRLNGLGKRTLMGTSGDISDLQATINMLKQYEAQELCYDDGHEMTPSQWHTAIAAQMYKRRSDMNPLWNAHVLAGVDPKTGHIFLGYADMLGTTYESDSIATGFGGYLAQPLLRNAVEGKDLDMTEAEAAALLENCLRVLYYRDARSLDKVQYAKVTAAGVVISEPTKVTSDWSIGKRSY